MLDVATEGKVRLQLAQSDATLTVAGQDLSGQVSEANGTTEITDLPNGLPASAPEGPRARIDAALPMAYPDRPVKVGETGKRTAEADQGLRAAEATYTYEGRTPPLRRQDVPPPAARSAVY